MHTNGSLENFMKKGIEAQRAVDDAIAAHSVDEPLADWLTEEETALRLEKNPRTLREWANKGKGPERKFRQRPGAKSEPVYNPADVARLAAPPPFVMPDESGGRPDSQALTRHIPKLQEQYATIVIRSVEAAPPRKPAVWVDLKTASGLTGFSVRFLRLLIHAGLLKSVRDGRTKVAEADLADLDAPRVTAAISAKSQSNRNMADLAGDHQ